MSGFAEAENPAPQQIESRTTQPLVCQAWLPISWSSDDTDQTILEVKLNNAAHACACEGRCQDDKSK